MGIKTYKKLFSNIFILFFLLFVGSFGIISGSQTFDTSDFPKISGSNLPNKVYLFQKPQDSLMLEDITLEQYYIYYLYVEIVTPYNCSVKITLWDPHGKRFNIFESTLIVEPEGFNYFEIPFGTALAGNYDIYFDFITPENLKLYIKMEK